MTPRPAMSARWHERVRFAAPGVGFWRLSAANVGLRFVTLASKLLFLVYIGKHLSVPDMAVYGLMTTTVGLGVTLLGLEFYAYSTREILSRETGQHAVVLRDQLAFYGVAYLLLLPLAVPVFATGILPWELAAWFYALAIAEHLAQETARLFNTLMRPVLSSVLFFFRSAGWGLVVMVIATFNPGIGITTVLAAWTAGVVLSLAMSVYALRNLGWRRAGQVPVDWQWIRRGVLVAMPFFASAAAYRVIELADRYIIHFLLSDEAVAVYSFYGTLANVLPAVIGAGVTSILVPRIVGAYQTRRMDDYRRDFRFMNIATVAVILITLPIVFAGIVALQPYLDRAEYARGLPTCAVLLGAAGVGIVAQLPGVALYARRDDMALLIAVIIGAVVNTALNFVLIPRYGISGAAWATALAYAAMGAYQLVRVARPPTRPMVASPA